MNNDYSVRTNLTDTPQAFDEEKADRRALIAKTILDQLGGNRFATMTGAKSFVALDSGVQFSIGRNSSKANKVVVKLDDSDTYTIEFWRVGRKTFEVASFSTVYADQLRSVFTAATGLHTSL